MAQELPDVRDKRLDPLNVAAQHDLVFAVDVGDEHLVDGRPVLGALGLAAGAAVADKLVDRIDQQLHVWGLAHNGHHAVLAAVFHFGGPRSGCHGVSPFLHHKEAVFELDVAARYEGRKLAEGVA